MKSIIEVNNLSKKYRFGLKQSYYSLRDSITDSVKSPFSLLAQKKLIRDGLADDEFWALKDIGFTVQQGDAIGIIGKNGAGKTTLLKILSRITPPTQGKAILRGRVSSLLEVGTGFHPELTGRENIYLNGAILGMKRREIKKKFDEIVDFAEIEKFLDTPVKHFSTGMYMRLAFAVAAYLEPEILIVDEVLAVGDIQFQKKCLGRMENVTKEGRTVLFVSHNMTAILSLCRKAILLEKGKIIQVGPSAKVIVSYLSHVAEGFMQNADHSDEQILIKKVILKNSKGKTTLNFKPGDSLIVEIHYHAKQYIQKPNFWIGVTSKHGPLFGASMLFDGNNPSHIKGNGKISCTFDSIPLIPNAYTVQMGVRASDGVTILTKTKDIGFFNVIGKMSEIGFVGEMADILSWDSSPMILPYEWRLPNGKRIKYQIKY